MREYIEATRFYTFEEFNRLVRDALKIPEGFENFATSDAPDSTYVVTNGLLCLL